MDRPRWNFYDFLVRVAKFTILFIIFDSIFDLKYILFGCKIVHLVKLHGESVLSSYRYKNIDVFYYGPVLNYQLKFEIQRFIWNFKNIDFDNNLFYLRGFDVTGGYLYNNPNIRFSPLKHPNLYVESFNIKNFYINLPSSTHLSTHPYQNFLNINFNGLNKNQYISDRLFFYFRDWVKPINFYQNYNFYNNYNVYKKPVLDHFNLVKNCYTFK